MKNDEKTMGGLGGEVPRENFRISEKIIFTSFTNFDNDYFKIMQSITGVWGAEPSKKVLQFWSLKSFWHLKKNANQQGRGVKTSVKLSRDITVYYCRVFLSARKFQI